MFDQYRSLLKVLVRYYRGYGGVRTFLSSPFTHGAFIVTLAHALGGLSIDWRAISASTLPTILGFSLAAYVLIFTLMGGELHSALSQVIEQRRSVNYLGLINSTFFHAILVQVVTYLFSVFSQGNLITSQLRDQTLPIRGGIGLDKAVVCATNNIGVFLSAYSLFLVIGVLVAVFRLASATQPTENVPAEEAPKEQ